MFMKNNVQKASSKSVILDFNEPNYKALWITCQSVFDFFQKLILSRRKKMISKKFPNEIA